MAKKENKEEPAINTPVVQTQEQKKEALTVKGLFEGPAIKKRFEELLGKNSQSFITSILQVVTNDKLLAVADPYSVYNAACTAAVMGLPINPNLGQAYIIGYKDNRRGGQVFAQFQMGWKGLVQLAQRTMQYKTLHTTEVYENQFESYNYMTGELKMKNVAPDFKTKVVGFVSYFSLLSGFEKTFYMTEEEMRQHAHRFSQSYRNGTGQWADETGYVGMGKKTVLKLNLDKYGPKSIEMQKAIQLDQAVINDESGNDFHYIDNQQGPVDINKEEERIKLLLDDAQTVVDLAKFIDECKTPELESYYMERKLNIETLNSNQK